MAFIIVDNPDINIWEHNPSLDLISEFREFKEKEGELRSSDILKAIYYIWDPKSDLRDSSIPESKLIADISNNLLGDPDFDWDAYDYIKEAYLEYNITKLESLLLTYEKEIHDLNEVLMNWRWDKNNINDKANAVKQYKVLFNEYIEIKEKAKMEAEEFSEMLGGYQKSMLEEYTDD